jgi:hypothetical protein
LVGICADATSGAAADLQDDFFELVEFPVGQPGKIGRYPQRIVLVAGDGDRGQPRPFA